MQYLLCLTCRLVKFNLRSRTTFPKALLLPSGPPAHTAHSCHTRSPHLCRLRRRIILGVQERRAKHQEADHDAQSGGVVRVCRDEEPLVLAVGEGSDGNLGGSQHATGGGGGRNLDNERGRELLERERGRNLSRFFLEKSFGHTRRWQQPLHGVAGLMGWRGNCESQTKRSHPRYALAAKPRFVGA